MADLPKYHIRTQQADALLAPVLASLDALEQRVQHYLDRINLAEAEAEQMRTAHAALASARQEIERLYRESQHIART